VALNQINLKEAKKFGLILAFILLVIGTIHFFNGHANVSLWFYSFSAAFFLISVLLPGFILPVYILSIKISRLIGWVNTRIILSIIFYLIVTPISLVMRLFKKDYLEKRIDKNKDSYWVKKEYISKDINRYEKAF
jgi:uncharacterized membrane protein YhfC